MRFRFSTLLPLAGVATLAIPASAQDFNVDVGADFGTPTGVSYGAASGQVGFWNALSGGVPYNATLTNVAGTLTGVTTNVVAVGNGLGDFSFDNPGTTGDDQMLMDDLQDVGNGGTPSTTTWTFSGLNNASYDVFVYAWAPDSSAFISSVSECNAGVVTMVGGAWPGGFSAGTTHAVLTTAVTGGTLEICVDGGGVAGNFSGVNGFQLTEGTSVDVGTPVCFGDGTGAPCGCLNESDPGSGGCRNSVSGTQGAFATATGTAGQDQTTNPLTFNVTNVRTQPGLFFSANNTIGGGTGSTFGDGLRCCGGGLVRVENINPPVGPEPVSVTTTATFTPAAPGTKRCYQYWYRDPGGPCGNNFNLSNGVTVTWGP